MNEENQSERVLKTWGAIPDPSLYCFPDPARGSPGDYSVLDKTKGNGVFIKYDPELNQRVMTRIGAWSKQ